MAKIYKKDTNKDKKRELSKRALLDALIKSSQTIHKKIRKSKNLARLI